MHGTRPSDEFLAISRHENPRHPRAGGASPGIIHSAEQVKIRTGSGRHTEEVQIPEPDDIRAILTTLNLFAEGDPLWRRWRGFMETAIHTGMRMSELRGLPWSSVDFDAGTITVRQRSDRRGVIGSPKSKAARREIPIPDSLVQRLRAPGISRAGVRTRT